MKRLYYAVARSFNEARARRALRHHMLFATRAAKFSSLLKGLWDFGGGDA